MLSQNKELFWMDKEFIFYWISIFQDTQMIEYNEFTYNNLELSLVWS